MAKCKAGRLGKNGLCLILSLFLFALGLSLAGVKTIWAADELEIINRPVNTSGLTGLFFTTSPFTLPTGTVEIGASVLSESSVTPHYTVDEFPLTVTVGIANTMELAVKGSYVRKDDASGLEKRGPGDTELSYKWNFRPQMENSVVPGVAMIITGILPTGDREGGLNRVQNWGARFGLATGTEILWRDHVLGIYADAQMAVQDLSNDLYRDRYTIVNAGMLFPISKQRNLQIFVEYNVVSGKDVSNIDGLNYSAVTSGLRLVSEKFNLSMGTQFLHKEKEPGMYSNAGRVIGMVSVKF